MDQDMRRTTRRPRRDEIEGYSDPLDFSDAESNDSLSELNVQDPLSLGDSDDKPQLEVKTEEVYVVSDDSSDSEPDVLLAETQEVYTVSDDSSDSESGYPITTFVWDEPPTTQEVPSEDCNDIVIPEVEYISCDACAKTFLNKRALTKHIKTQCCKGIHDPLQVSEKSPAAKRGKCGPNDEVSQIFGYDTDDDSPQIIHEKKKRKKRTAKATTKRIYSCKVCKKPFSNKRHVKPHLKTHKARKHACPNCGETFVTSRDLSCHAITHLVANSYACPLCPEMFKTYGTLKWHKTKYHSGNVIVSMENVCDVCGKPSRTPNAMKVHRLTHTVQKSVPCETCLKSFRDWKALQRHLLLAHKAVEKYDCTKCDRKFVVKEYFDEHLLKHAVVKTYECEFCHKLFSKQSSRYKHSLIHLKEGNCEAKVIQIVFPQV